MTTKRFAGILILIVALIIGCAGNYGTFKRQSRSESKVTKQQLVNNWKDYDILLVHTARFNPPRLIGIIFDMKNDDKKITIRSDSSKVIDQAMWSEIVNENTASDGEFTLVRVNTLPYYSTGVSEIGVPTTNCMDILSIKNMRWYWIQWSWSMKILSGYSEVVRLRLAGKPL